jgi:hypothetical protein
MVADDLVIQSRVAKLIKALDATLFALSSPSHRRPLANGDGPEL